MRYPRRRRRVDVRLTATAHDEDWPFSRVVRLPAYAYHRDDVDAGPFPLWLQFWPVEPRLYDVTVDFRAR